MLRTAYRILAYYGTLGCFALHAFAFNLRWMLLLRAGGGPASEHRVQRAIQGRFRLLTQWLAFARLVTIEYRGFEHVPPSGAVIVANHPGLLDAIYLLARWPAAICVFKPALRRNPLFGPAATRAGYLRSDRRLALVRSGAAKISRGATLLVFPEGTRTPAHGTIGRFKPGFALIARRARAPVQLVRITVTGSLMTKEQAWWRLPQLPAHVRIEAGPRLDSTAFRSTPELVGAAEAWFRGHMPNPAAYAFEAFPRRSSSLTLTAS